MNNKLTFAEFIAQKRKQAGLTQTQMAQKLYVTDAAVSKWERGLSYPDITLISPICNLLGITEHEFITASDDVAGRAEKIDAKKYRRLSLGAKIAMLAAYGVTILTCFICNLAVGHTLSWFFIVLFSLALGFSVLTLPVFIRREKWLICSGAATASLFVLLFVIAVVDGTLNNLGKALLIALLPVGIYWACLLFVRFTPISGWFKGAALTLAVAASSMINLFIAAVLGEPANFNAAQVLNIFVWSGLDSNTLSNKIVFWSLILIALALAGVGFWQHYSKKNN